MLSPTLPRGLFGNPSEKMQFSEGFPNNGRTNLEQTIKNPRRTAYYNTI